jgi:hypothetical protein
MKRFTFALVLLIVCSVAARTHAADSGNWLQLDGLGQLTQRLTITVHNPADVDTDAALVHVKLSDLASKLADAKEGQIAVTYTVPPKPEPKKDRANEWFVPFQVNDGVLTFAVPMKAGEKKELFVYTSPNRLNMPGFPAKTAWDNRFAYRSFENNLMAFRMETGPGANTTGMAIDLFGKTAQGKGLRLVEAYEHGHDSYHKLQYWGIDCLKLGSSPGVGGIYIVAGDQMGRPTYQTTIVECLHAGPVETLLRVTGPVEVGGRKVMVERMLTLWGDERGIDDDVRVTGDNVADLQLGIALRNLPNEKWTEETSTGYAMVNGDNNQPNYKRDGLGVVFDPSEFDRVVDLKDNENGGHVYVLKARQQNGALVSHHHLGAIWDGDGQISEAGEFGKYLAQWSKRLNKPATVQIGGRAESK